MPDDVIKLREFMDERWAAHQQQHDEQRQAVNLAAGLMNERLATMNEFRAQLDRQTALFVTRDQLAIILDARTVGHDKDFATVRLTHEKDVDTLNERLAAAQQRIDLLEKRNANQDGRFVAVAGVLAFVAFAIPLVLHYLFP